MLATKGGYKRRHIMPFFPVAAKNKSGDGHSTNSKEQNGGPAASTSNASVTDKDLISVVGGLNKQKKRSSGIDPAQKEAFQWLEITADEAVSPSHWVICAHF
ncbi:hypothetical protein AMECASPLE_034048 [Ameca splendens]|uniref:Uncharacterized protein n=1 Tax=Ameca splendens TaxID=208324 RepID=A0ABV0XK17_9TELE